MTITSVTNTRDLPAGECIAVQASDDASALKSLQVIAARRGVRICENVFRWGQGYYYVEVATKENA